MLHDNLSKIRKERGLTQEALAIKLNVVRQTISKWEKGTAVPDADMLVQIAEALETPVAELLGVPSGEERQDAVAKTLAEINEQLAIRNRLSRRVWKIIGFTVLGAVVLMAAEAALCMVNFSNLIIVDESGSVSLVWEADQSGLPLFANLSEMPDGDIADALSAVKKEQLHAAWGEPVSTQTDSELWEIGDELFLRVRYDAQGYVTACGKEW